MDSNRLEIPAESKKTMKIRFGMPEKIAESIRKKGEDDGLKEGKKAKKEKGGKGKKEKGSGKSKRSREKGSKVKNPEDELYYIAKFNVLLGSTYLRDIIVIGKFP